MTTEERPPQPWYHAGPWFKRALIGAMGIGGVNYHDQQMDHMRERIADVRNDARDRYEVLQQHCFERQIDRMGTTRLQP